MHAVVESAISVPRVCAFLMIDPGIATEMVYFLGLPLAFSHSGDSLLVHWEGACWKAEADESALPPPYGFWWVRDPASATFFFFFLER